MTTGRHQTLTRAGPGPVQTPEAASVNALRTPVDPAREPVPGLGVTVQRTLAVGAADDPLEVEAERVAADVVAVLRRRTGATAVEHDHDGSAGCCASPTVRRRAVPDVTVGLAGGVLSSAQESVLTDRRGTGQALSSAVRAPLEEALSADLSAVRLHQGPEAAQLNRSMSALAFTHGQDIYFRDGVPDTGTDAGLHLLAHELTHTVQQGSAPVRPAARAVRRRSASPAVQRMSIAFGTEKPVKYALGDTKKFITNVEAFTKEEFDHLALLGCHTKEDFQAIFTRLARTTVTLLGLDRVKTEFRLLRENWGPQGVYYDSPRIPGAPEPHQVKGQKKGQPVRLYGSKSREVTSNLYRWAVKEGVTIQGHAKLFEKPYPTGDPTYLPKGHWGDRAHTVSYGMQEGQDRSLVCIELTPAASADVKRLMADETKISKGGEGYEDGNFGFKHEGDYVSVALNGARRTWDFMRSQIAKIDFNPPL